MAVTFFKFKIYRKKFITTIFLVILASTVLFLGLCAFFTSGWLNKQREYATYSFADSEQRIRRAVDQIDAYILRLFSDSKIIEDLSSLFSSATEVEYLAARRENSLSNKSQIRYFAGNMRSILVDGSGVISGVTVVSKTGTKLVRYNWMSGDVETVYGLKNEQDALELLGNTETLLAKYPVNNPKAITEQIGEINFFASVKAAANSSNSNVGMCALVGGDSDTAWSQQELLNSGWLKTAASFPDNMGSFGDGVFNRVNYTKFSSSLYGYQYVAVIDTKTLLGQNSGTLLILLAAFVLLDTVVITWILHGIRYDARFLSYMLDMISNMERGDFLGAKRQEFPVFFRKNEYGILAEAIKNMSHTLDEYIRTEYLMKIKQQQTAMAVLQHQINPHFLYNTLETIRSHALIVGDHSTADAIALLGSLYRDVVRGGSVVTMRDEFDLLENYLQIMHLRYSESFSYQILLEPGMDELQTLKFWMQPIAENFFSHGFDITSEYNLFIATGYEEEGGWRIELIDNGSGIPIEKIEEYNATMRMGDDSTGTHIGLRNVYERLAYFYGEDFTMEIRNNLEGGACVSIHIPRKENKDVHTADN